MKKWRMCVLMIGYFTLVGKWVVPSKLCGEPMEVQKTEYAANERSFDAPEYALAA